MGGLVTLVLALLPGLQLRLHHYIISMALLPVGHLSGVLT